MNDHHLAALRRDLIMDQLRLYIQRCFGHAIGIPGGPPAVPDAARLGGDVDDELTCAF
ncbi:hypothetical protein D3C73_1526710 [compost metagenome]